MPKHTALQQKIHSTPRIRIALRLRDWSEWARQAIRGVQGYAHAKPNWHLYIASGPAEAVDIFADDQSWDGILCQTFDRPAAWRRLLLAGRTKVVSVTSSPPPEFDSLPSVRVDDMRIANAIGRHLLSAGFRKLAYFKARTAGPEQDHRKIAMLAFAESEGIPCDIYEPATGPAMTTPGAATWISRLEKPVGIVVWNMYMARQVLQACKRAGAVVPDQVAVVGWDDDALVAESAEPTITGAVLPVERLGHEAAALLDRLLSGEPPPRYPILIESSTVLHVRRSSDASTVPDRDVHSAVQYINEHASDPLRVHELVKVLQISRSKLERDFSRVTGQTINHAIIEAHLKRARQLLIETNWSIERVAEKSGFGTKQHFHHVFSAHEGTTPARYRARFGAQPTPANSRAAAPPANAHLAPHDWQPPDSVIGPLNLPNPSTQIDEGF